jgi:hypothetical protein
VNSSLTATIRISEPEEISLMKKDEANTLEDDIKERLRNLESHLGLEVSRQDVLTRLKTLEDKIMRIEELYPQVALRTFKYESDPTKGSGRLSKAPELFTDAVSPLYTQNKKIDEMKQRLSELKNVISK